MRKALILLILSPLVAFAQGDAEFRDLRVNRLSTLNNLTVAGKKTPFGGTTMQATWLAGDTAIEVQSLTSAWVTAVRGTSTVGQIAAMGIYDNGGSPFMSITANKMGSGAWMPIKFYTGGVGTLMLEATKITASVFTEAQGTLSGDQVRIPYSGGRSSFYEFYRTTSTGALFLKDNGGTVRQSWDGYQGFTTFSLHVMPNAGGMYDLGLSDFYRWRKLWAINADFSGLVTSAGFASTTGAVGTTNHNTYYGGSWYYGTTATLSCPGTDALKTLSVYGGVVTSASCGATGSGGITGSGTNNTITKWTGTSTIGNSSIADDGSAIWPNGAASVGKITNPWPQGYFNAMRSQALEIAQPLSGFTTWFTLKMGGSSEIGLYDPANNPVFHLQTSTNLRQVGVSGTLYPIANPPGDYSGKNLGAASVPWGDLWIGNIHASGDLMFPSSLLGGAIRWGSFWGLHLTNVSGGSYNAVGSPSFIIDPGGSFYIRTFSGGDVACGGITSGWLGYRTDTNELQTCNGGVMKKVGFL